MFDLVCQYRRLLILMLGLLVLSGPANASDGFLSNLYVKTEAGASVSGDTGPIEIVDWEGTLGILRSETLGRGAVLGIGAGAKVSEAIRIEIMVNHRRGHELDTNEILVGAGNQNFSGHVTSTSLMAGAAYDILTVKVADVGVTPNLFGMAGVSNNRVDEILASEPGFANSLTQGRHKTSLAWGVGAGVGIQLTEKTTLDLGYRYVDLGKFRSGAKTSGGAVGTLERAPEGRYAVHEIVGGVRLSF